MKEVYKILKEATILYVRSIQVKEDKILKSISALCKKVYIIPSINKAKEFINNNENIINIIVCDYNLSQHNTNIAVFLIKDNQESIKLTDTLRIISSKIKSSLRIKQNYIKANKLSKILQEERSISLNLEKVTENNMHKLKAFNYIVNELLVIFEINKDGLVTFTNKNFVKIFGYKEEYIINNNIANISSNSKLQKALLEVTRFKKPVTEYVEFSTKTGVLIEPLVVTIPHFNKEGYLSNYTLYCSLQ